MKEVTKEHFYAALYADRRDIMPSIVGGWDKQSGYTQEWRAAGRQLWGKSQCGDCHGSDEGKRFWMVEEANR